MATSTLPPSGELPGTDDGVEISWRSGDGRVRDVGGMVKPELNGSFVVGVPKTDVAVFDCVVDGVVLVVTMASKVSFCTSVDVSISI